MLPEPIRLPTAQPLPWLDTEPSAIPTECKLKAGVALSDPSEGLMSHWWECWSDGGNVYAYVDYGNLPIGLMSIVDEVLTLSVAFDQNMAQTVAYSTASGNFLYWYDPLAASFVHLPLPAGAYDVRVTMDDKRPSASTGGWNDVVLAYVRDGTLYYRYQRERYQTEHEYLTPVVRLVHIGMNVGHKFQFMYI